MSGEQWTWRLTRWLTWSWTWRSMRCSASWLTTGWHGGWQGGRRGCHNGDGHGGQTRIDQDRLGLPGLPGNRLVLQFCNVFNRLLQILYKKFGVDVKMCHLINVIQFICHFTVQPVFQQLAVVWSPLRALEKDIIIWMAQRRLLSTIIAL